MTKMEGDTRQSSGFYEQLKAHLTTQLARLDVTQIGLNVGGAPTDHISYGTAGFRGRADKIEHLFFRVGLMAGLRSMHAKGYVGVMITASHNPVEDNGVKLIDPNGEMLHSSWEPLVEKFCNVNFASRQQLVDELCRIASNQFDGEQMLVEQKFQYSQVLIGCDTRPSSEKLMKLVKLACDTWAPFVGTNTFGQLTTPALHYLVAESTKKAPGFNKLEDYFNMLASGFVNSSEQLREGKEFFSYDATHLVIDCANGVGYNTLSYLAEAKSLPLFHGKYLPYGLINTGDGVLNSSCGADFVKTKQVAPVNACDQSKRYAALDGDADRVVYFYLTRKDNEKLCLHLLDGDKILALYALFVKEILKKYNLENQLAVGIVQTAYANGASTDYVENELKLRVVCVDTGVKHLHKEAQHFDLGLYFEANGHGTILVSERAKQVIENENIVEFRWLLSILNNYTGDAISDVLIVELILNYYDWDIKRWDALYTDRASSLIKVEVKDRSCVVTTNAGQTCVKPDGLQVAIDELVKKFSNNSRCFVRASGTENVVRVYAESDDQDSANKLAHLVGQRVVEMCNI